MAKLIHFFATFHTLGGVESILAHHQQRDRVCGFDSVVACAFSKAASGKSDVACLGLTGFSTIVDLRKRFSELIRRHQPETAIYHNLWGCHSLCDLDRASRRIGFIHTDSAPMRQVLARDAVSLDGIIAVSQPIADYAASVWPQPERVRQIAYPVARPPEFPSLHPVWHEPFRLGFCGRLVVEQKRVDRLPLVWQKFRGVFPEAVLEILGEGAEHGKLENFSLTAKSVLLSGRRTGRDYWQTISNWDAVIFTSDYEGTPISLLEAMSAGVLPVYPVTGSGGDDYVRKLSPSLLYRHEDADSLPSVFQWLKARSGGEIYSLRQRARELVAGHSLENYFRQFTAAVADIEALPPVSRQRPAEIPWWKARIPFGFWNEEYSSVMP